MKISMPLRSIVSSVNLGFALWSRFLAGRLAYFTCWDWLCFEQLGEQEGSGQRLILLIGVSVALFEAAVRAEKKVNKESNFSS